MKRNIFLGVFLLSAICVGSMLMRPVSAQEEVSGDGETDIMARPEASLLAEDFGFTGALNANGWSVHSGAGTNPISTTTGLTYTGYPGSNAGNAALVGNAGGEDANRPLSFEQNTNGGVVYFSSLVNVNETASDKTGDYFIHIGDRVAADSFTLFASRVFVKITANVVNFGLSNTSTATYGTTNFAKNTTYLIIVKYTINTAGADTTQLWVLPSGIPSSEAAAGTPEVTNSATTGQDIIDAVALRQGSNANSAQVVVDGIRVGTSWVDVLGFSPTPNPSARFLFTTRLSGANEVPANSSTGKGYGRVVLNAAETEITASFYWEGLSSGTTMGHIHTGPTTGTGPVTFDMTPTPGLTSGSTVDRTFAVTPAEVATLRAGGMYFNIHTTNFGGGEIRGQIVTTLPDPPYDFNGDGKTDFGVIRQTVNGTKFRWFNLTNTTPPVETQLDFGNGSDSATPGDFDGDGKDDIAVWRGATDNGYFYILQSSNNTVRYVRFGTSNDDPFQIADFDGDGIDDPAIYRPGASNSAQSQFWWYGSYGVTKNVQVVVNWGLGSDQAAPGDYTGDGKADFCVVRSVSNRLIWFIHPGTGGFDAVSDANRVVRFGLPTDAVVPGDFDGDGTTDISVTRSETVAGTAGQIVWYMIPSSGVELKRRAHWGRSATDFEAQGDYDGDGRTDQAVWRSPASGGQATFYILRSSDGAPQYQNWGFTGDIPAVYDVHNN